MTKEEKLEVVHTILKHSNCITMLDAIIDTAMHSKYLHRRKLDQVRPADSKQILELMKLIPLCDASDVAVYSRQQQLEEWINASGLTVNFISPRFLDTEASIQKWVRSLDVPANVVYLSNFQDGKEVPCQGEVPLSKEVALRALRDFFQSDEAMNAYLALYEQAYDVKVRQTETYN